MPAGNAIHTLEGVPAGLGVTMLKRGVSRTRLAPAQQSGKVKTLGAIERACYRGLRIQTQAVGRHGMHAGRRNLRKIAAETIGGLSRKSVHQIDIEDETGGDDALTRLQRGLLAHGLARQYQARLRPGSGCPC